MLPLFGCMWFYVFGIFWQSNLLSNYWYLKGWHSIRQVEKHMKLESTARSMLRKQLVAAIGKEVSPSEFGRLAARAALRRPGGGGHL